VTRRNDGNLQRYYRVEKLGNMCALLILYTTLIWSIQGKDSELTMIGTQSVGRESMEIHLKWRGIKWEIICL
jgi:hypothetical protein